MNNEKIQFISDSATAAGSAFGAQAAFNATHPQAIDDTNLLGQILVPIIVGVVVPFLKDFLYSFLKRKKEKEVSN